MRLISWSRRRVQFVIPLAGLVVLVAGGAAAAIESDTIDGFWQGAWWALSLMTTVGFVGSEPLTTGGKVISAVLMVTGFALLATVTATIASIFVREEQQPEERTLQTLENACSLRFVRSTSACGGLKNGLMSGAVRRALHIGDRRYHFAVEQAKAAGLSEYARRIP